MTARLPTKGRARIPLDQGQVHSRIPGGLQRVIKGLRPFVFDRSNPARQDAFASGPPQEAAEA